VARVSTPGKRFTASRRVHAGDRKAIAQHNYRVGEVVHAFNAAQASFFLIFSRLAADTNITLALALWDTQASDLSQRKLLDAHVRHSVKRKVIKRNLLWAIAAMNELAEHRNDAVHADFIWYYDRIIPGLATKQARSERLEARPFDTIWKDLRGDLAAIANYVFDLHYDLAADEAWPSTKRPRLKLARSMSARQQSQRRQARKSARERQRQASRP
jgi:hypothetical protein